jgi:hypothetical protein
MLGHHAPGSHSGLAQFLPFRIAPIAIIQAISDGIVTGAIEASPDEIC